MTSGNGSSATNGKVSSGAAGCSAGSQSSCRTNSTARKDCEILQAFATIFEERKLPHYGVIHKPDDNNDSRNYHAHFAYYDRPSSKLQNGTWDFEDADTKQNKDREVPRSALGPRSSPSLLRDRQPGT